MQINGPLVVARGPQRFEDLAIGIRRVVAAPEGDLLCNRAYGGHAADGPEAGRPDGYVDAALERDGVRRLALNEILEVRRCREDTGYKVEGLRSLRRARRQDWQDTALARRQDVPMIAAGGYICR